MHHHIEPILLFLALFKHHHMANNLLIRPVHTQKTPEHPVFPLFDSVKHLLQLFLAHVSVYHLQEEVKHIGFMVLRLFVEEQIETIII